jgi:tRNA U54 and U55 pseudouridine synthase Pus10
MGFKKESKNKDEFTKNFEAADLLLRILEGEDPRMKAHAPDKSTEEINEELQQASFDEGAYNAHLEEQAAKAQEKLQSEVDAYETIVEKFDRYLDKLITAVVDGKVQLEDMKEVALLQHIVLQQEKFYND